MGMDKPEFVTSCCGHPIEDCPGCPGGMMLIRKDEYMSPEEKEIEESLQPILAKIEDGTATADDFNRLIQEATPESARDRLRRRQNQNQDTVRSHQDEEGHSDIQLPTMADRVQPKRERADRTQMQHRGKLGHRHSARTQKRTMSKSLREAVEFFQENIGKPIDQKLLADVEDHNTLRTVAIKLMGKSGINRDWLSNFCDFLGDPCLKN